MIKPGRADRFMWKKGDVEIIYPNKKPSNDKAKKSNGDGEAVKDSEKKTQSGK